MIPNETFKRRPLPDLRRFRRWFHPARPFIPSEVFQVLVAIGVGLLTGFAGGLFINLLRLSTHFFLGEVKRAFWFLGPFALVPLPVMGGLLVGPMIYFFAREAKGSGVPEVMTTIVARGGRIRDRVVLVKLLASVFTIGSGGSAGRIGPMIQIGAGIGSSIAQRLKLPEPQIRTFLACGAAGGVAAAFNAPLAGALFSLEVLIGRFTMGFALIVLASVAAAIVSRLMLGNFPAFEIPPYDLISEKELIFYLLLGVLTALAATAFVKALYGFEELFDRLPLPEYLKPALGGFLVGGIGIGLPQALGDGFPAAEAALKVQLPFLTLVLLIPSKILSTSLTLGSGGSGGVFFPSLFIGGMVGGSLGYAVHTLFPSFTAFYGAYALVGMGASLGAAAQAPLTAILLIFEMTNDYRIILPLMAATVVSTLIFRILNEESIYTLKLRKRGLSYLVGWDTDPMASIPVRDALTHRWLSVSPEMTIARFLETMEREEHEWFPIVDKGGELVGVITADDAQRAVERNELEAKVIDYATRKLVVASPDESLQEVMKKFDEGLGHLPVVLPGNPRRLVGIISRLHAIRAYNRALRERQKRGGFIL